MTIRGRWEELEKDKNVFSLVVMAHLKVQETKDDTNQRYLWKRKLIRMLYERKYSKEDILEMFRFLDWLIVLPEDLEQKLEQELEEMERSESMPYITGIERRAIQRGLEKGMQEGLEKGMELGLREGRQEGRQEGLLEEAREAVLDNLEIKFGDVPKELFQTISSIPDLNLLKSLRKKAIQVTSLEEFCKQFS